MKNLVKTCLGILSAEKKDDNNMLHFKENQGLRVFLDYAENKCSASLWKYLTWWTPLMSMLCKSLLSSWRYGDGKGEGAAFSSGVDFKGTSSVEVQFFLEPSRVRRSLTALRGRMVPSIIWRCQVFRAVHQPCPFCVGHCRHIHCLTEPALTTTTTTTTFRSHFGSSGNRCVGVAA